MLPAPQASADQQMQAPLFRCAECNEPVIVWSGRFFRTCNHLAAPINATPEAAKVANANP